MKTKFFEKILFPLCVYEPNEIATVKQIRFDGHDGHPFVFVFNKPPMSRSRQGHCNVTVIRS